VTLHGGVSPDTRAENVEKKGSTLDEFQVFFFLFSLLSSQEKQLVKTSSPDIANGGGMKTETDVQSSSLLFFTTLEPRVERYQSL